VWPDLSRELSEGLVIPECLVGMMQEHAFGVVHFRVPRITNAFVALRRKICAFQAAKM